MSLCFSGVAAFPGAIWRHVKVGDGELWSVLDVGAGIQAYTQIEPVWPALVCTDEDMITSAGVITDSR